MTNDDRPAPPRPLGRLAPPHECSLHHDGYGWRLRDADFPHRDATDHTYRLSDPDDPQLDAYQRGVEDGIERVRAVIAEIYIALGGTGVSRGGRSAEREALEAARRIGQMVKGGAS